MKAVDTLRIASILVSVLFSHSTSACSCGGYEIEKAFDEYEVVFVGKAVSVGEQSLFEGRKLFWEGMRKVKFEVKRSYKGTADVKVTVFTSNQSSACGYPFEKDTEYAVFANRSHDDPNDSKLYVGACGPTIHTDERDDPHEDERKYVLEYLESK
jgi:Tissue inhibitor of metalloproteinase